MASRTAKTFRLIDNDIWKEYRKTYPPKKYMFQNREQFKVVVKEIFKVIGLLMIEKTGGVLIKGLGYFFNFTIPKSLRWTVMTKGEKVKEKYNFDTDNKITVPTFLPCKELEAWSMDSSFSNPVKQDLKNNLWKGRKYKMYPYTFKNIID